MNIEIIQDMDIASDECKKHDPSLKRALTDDTLSRTFHRWMNSGKRKAALSMFTYLCDHRLSNRGN